MKLLLCLLLCVVSVSKISGSEYRRLLYSDWITCDHNRTLDLDVSKVQVFFYDFQNNFNITYQIDSAVNGIFTNYNLDVTRKLIFFVLGYKSHIRKKNEELIRQTFSDVKNTYLIIIDHSEYTNARDGKIQNYDRSVFYSYYIGTALGKLLAGFRKKGYPSKNIHAVGHDLGSQMLGFAGTEYTKETSEKIWRITALDPAGPYFSNSLIDDQVRSGVAEYVEVYHCSSGGLGTESVLADTDFFINRASKQPPCLGFNESGADKCSHNMCVEYWAKTVHQPSWYLAWACDSYDLFSAGKCSANQMTIAGYSNPGNATGVFYVSTETYGLM
ncbi:phospholipase A1 2-like [Pectinophora gossypiella]|uniref:phospholipase A1 2-like n=1 Tax=Pectinophora gossypiella TaxID=13191 RepID=UPI00214F071E|nr:phospholipase A1 2-like [Pectinophora gossypiella]